MSKAVNYEERRQSFQTECSLGLCNTHPDDPEVLLTENPVGLYACRDPHVKAIIWQRELTQDIASSFKESPLVIARTLGYRSIAFNSATQEARNTDQNDGIPINKKMGTLLREPIQNDIQRLNALFCAASGYPYTRSGFSHSSNLKLGFHSDGGNIRLHTAYVGTGLEWFAMSPPSRSQYDACRAPFPQIELRSHFTNTGDVTLFKGQFSKSQNSLTKHHVPDGRIAGLMHRSPEGTETRLIYSVDDSYDP
jgi:hypothetical protein